MDYARLEWIPVDIKQQQSILYDRETGRNTGFYVTRLRLTGRFAISKGAETLAYVDGRDVAREFAEATYLLEQGVNYEHADE